MAIKSYQRTVVVTGSSSGIGEALALQLAQDGWKVFACVRKEADGNRLSKMHENLRPLFLDITNQDEITSAFEEVRSAVGNRGLDALVNNAGMLHLAPTEFVPISDMKSVFDINVFGHVRVTQAAMPLLRLGTPGRIINMGSIGGQYNFPYGGSYCGSKAALESLSEVMRREVKRWGIKVSLIKPGPVKTNAFEVAFRQRDELKKKFPPGTECHNLYGKDLDHLDEAMGVFEKAGALASDVVKTVVRVMNARRPKNMYFDTWKTHFSMKVFQRVPISFRDSNLAKVFFVN